MSLGKINERSPSYLTYKDPDTDLQFMDLFLIELIQKFMEDGNF